MSGWNESPAYRDTIVSIVAGSAAILLGLVREATSIRPARLLADVVAAHPQLHPGLLLFSCGLALTGWGIRSANRTVRRPTRVSRRAPAPADEANVALQQDPRADLVARARFAAELSARVDRPGGTSVLVVDVDGVRALVRTHGSAGANELLRQFARRVRDLAPAGASVVSLSSDELAVLLPPCDEAESRVAAANLIASNCKPCLLHGQPIDIAASVGIAMGPADGTTADALLRSARLAVALAKADGGHKWRMYDKELCRVAQERAALRADIRPGLEAGQFVPYYQPIVSLSGGGIVGMEVLSRWHHPERGVLAPDAFIDLMEEQHLCGQLSVSLLRQVVVDAVTWPRAWTFAFNASAGQLRDLLTFTTEAIGSDGCSLDPSRIELEMTETVLIDDMPLARRVVQVLHRAGAKVALDDFGTGYANLLPLRDLPFDRIKIDRGFVRDMLLSARTDACLRAMLSLARSLGASVIAEGVESEATESRLREMGCDCAQGFYYSQPVPAEGVALMARRVESRTQSRPVAA